MVLNMSILTLPEDKVTPHQSPAELDNLRRIFPSIPLTLVPFAITGVGGQLATMRREWSSYNRAILRLVDLQQPLHTPTHPYTSKQS